MQKLLTARWKGRSVMTLKELRESIDDPKIGLNYQLVREGKIFLCVRIDEAELTAYQNGFIVYRLGDHTATFPVTECADYIYRDADGRDTVIPQEVFDTQDWTIRALMEGEDRIRYNGEKRQKEREFGAGESEMQETSLYLELAGEEQFVDQEPSWEEKQIEEEKSEALKALMSTLKPRHQEVLYKRYWEEMSFQEIAAEWGCEVKAVRHTECRAWKALRSRIEKNKKNY